MNKFQKFKQSQNKSFQKAIFFLFVFAFGIFSFTLVSAARDFKIQEEATGIPLFFIEGDNGYIGIGTDAPDTLLTLTNNSWISAKNADGTGYVNMFKVNASNEIEVGGTLNIGTIGLAADSGAVNLVNMPVTATPAQGTEESYSFSLDSEVLLKVYSEADGTGGIQNKRIGINTVSPQKTLDVTGDAEVSNQVSAGSAYVTNDVDVATGNLLIHTGKVGIGTTSPDAPLTINYGSATEYTNSFDMALGIVADTDSITGLEFKNLGESGNVRFMAKADDNEYTSMNIPGSSSTGNWFGITKGSGVFLLAQPVGQTRDMGIGTLGSSNLILGTKNEERMRIDEDGNVGIGTTSPDSQLHVNNGLVSVRNTVDSTYQTPTEDYHLTPKGYVDDVITVADEDWVGVGGDPTLAGEIYHTGNVGIGTTDPDYKLDVYGTEATDAIRTYSGLDIKKVGAPDSFTGTPQSGSGLKVGEYYYRVSYITNLGESSPEISAKITTTPGEQQILLDLPVSDDPRVTGRKIYRTEVDGPSYLMGTVTTVNNNEDTTYLDSTADVDLFYVSQESCFKADTTTNYITVNGTSAMMLDQQRTSLGFEAGENDEGGENTYIGYRAGQNSESGNRQTIVGRNAGRSATGGNVNIFGANAGSASTGSNAVLLGSYAGYRATGDDQIIIGGHAGYTASGEISGSGNVAIGRAVLANYDVDFTGSYNVFIGRYSGRNDDQLLSSTNSIAIGANTFTTKSNQVVLGDKDITETLLRGNVGIGTTDPDSQLHINNGLVSVRNTVDSTYQTPTEDYHLTPKGYVDDVITAADEDWVGVGGGDPTLAGEIYHTGNVGIGTTDPDYKLDVGGNINITSGNNYLVNGSQISSSDLSDGSDLLKNIVEDTNPQLGGNLNVGESYLMAPDGARLLDFEATREAVNFFQIVNSAPETAVQLQALGEGERVSLALMPKGDGVVAVGNARPNPGLGTFQVMGTIYSSEGATFMESVGIGTTSPDSQLHVNNGLVSVRNTVDSTYQTPTEDYHLTPKGYVDDVITAADEDWVGVGGGDPTLAGEIYHTGNVGIGTTSPGAKLQVNGTTVSNPLLHIEKTNTGANAIFKISDTNSPDSYWSIEDGSGSSTFLPSFRFKADSAISSYLIGDTTTDTGDWPVVRISGRADNSALSNRPILDIANVNDPKVTFLANGNVGIGTVSPDYTLHTYTPTASGSSYLQIDRQADTEAVGLVLATAGTPDWYNYVTADADRSLIWNDGITDLMTLTNDGYLGIGPDYASPNALLDVNNKFLVSDTQVTVNVSLNLASAGDISFASDLIFTNPTASYIKSQAPLYIEAGDPAQNVDLTLRASNAGKVIVDDVLRVVSNAYLDGGATLAAPLNMDGQNIEAVDKLTVNTIDPIHEINDKEYATFVSFYAGGQKMETSGVINLEIRNSDLKIEGSDYFYVIDFENLEEGSDLWLFWETVHQDLEKLTIALTPGFNGRVWYQKIGNNKIIIFGDQLGEVSYTLVAPRYDYKKWPNLVSSK